MYARERIPAHRCFRRQVPSDRVCPGKLAEVEMHPRVQTRENDKRVPRVFHSFPSFSPTREFHLEKERKRKKQAERIRAR